LQFRNRTAAALLAPAAALLAFAYALPLAGIVLDSLHVAGVASLDNYHRLFATPVFLRIVWRTVRLAALTTGICLLLGYPLAYWLARMRSGWRPALLLLVSVPFFTSILIRSYAWVAILGNNGLVNRALMAIGLTDSPVRMMFNEAGTLIGMAQIQLPLMVLTLYGVMLRIDRLLLRAAHSLGADPCTAFYTVFLPLSRPGLVAGLSLVFTSCLGFYTTPAMLGGPGQYVVTQAVEARVTAMSDGGTASAEGTLLLAAVALLMVLFRRRLGLTLPASGGLGADAGWGRRSAEWPRPIAAIARRLAAALTQVGEALLVLLAGVALVMLVLPILVVVPLAFSSAPFLAFPPPGVSLRWFAAYLSDPDWIASTWFSFWVSAVAASFATALGMLSAHALVRLRPRGGATIYLLWASPLVLPHLVIAVSLYGLLAHMRLIGNPLTFVAAYAVLGLPYPFVVLAAALQKLDPILEQAAATLGAPPAAAWRTVTLPLIFTALASGFVFAFLVGFDDLVVSLFLASPGAYPLPLRMWDDIRQEISPRIAAVAVVFFGVALAASVLLGVARTVWRRASDAFSTRREFGLGQ